ncbi:uncharacterized protein LOC114306623 [Camellia sinensis]|uniref:uncharacterized protein LOC114306623 n=1 Tax=Camellia sinensis TaxID=4442 RepID=UPI001036C4AF|nr:uncharacterized protein LOC114306623 [Camellia sinensis]
MSRKRAEDMKWFKEKRQDVSVLRHPADSDEWKEFDTQHPEFALEPRNVRLGLATDGFNLLKNMNNSYSLWPVVLIPYNLPPWLAMKDPFFMLSLLILGESQPGIDIDVYMRPLVKELNELWKNERRKSRAYNGKHEKRKRSLVIPIEKIEEQLGSLTGVTYEKHPSNRKRPRQNPNWTKVSILYELPYWKKRRLRHNIDVMHVDKNFSENAFGTMLGIDGKNKDTDKARMDLEDMNIRKELWLTTNSDGSYVKPRASFSLTPKEREGFFEFLKSIKYLDGYAANISRSVNAKNGRLTGLKSHDCHVLIQRILPIGMRGYVDKEISTTLFESAFFNVMVHLAIHLPRETILGKHVQYRWMCPIESSSPIKLDQKVLLRRLTLSRSALLFAQCILKELRDIAHWFLLYNSLEIEKYLQEHKNLLQIPTGQDITQIQQKEFPKWFKEYINRLRVDEAPEATEELWSLANGPNFLVKEYSGCIINCVRFHTKELDNRRKSQNSGVLIEGDYKGEMHEFYGHLCNIWKFEYMCQNKVVLFQCKWYNTGNTGRSRTIQHRGVFDVPEVSDGEPPDQPEFNDAFQQENINLVVLINIEDIIRFHKDDIEAEVIPNKTKRDDRDDEEDEELGVLDDDMDPDMKPDMDYDM